MNAKRNLMLPVCAGLLMLAIACNSRRNETTIDLETVKKEIAISNAIYFKAFARNDSSIFINRYAEDACILAPFAPASCGRENILKFFRSAYDDYGMRNGQFITTTIYGNADNFVTEEGIWKSINAKGELFDDGKFLVLWKKTKEGWKMYRDSFSSNRKQ